MTESDARRILQVNGAASSADIRRAYLDLVKVWHPDRFQGDARLRERAERTLQQINDAYTLLERDAAPAPRPAVKPVSPAAPEPDPVMGPRGPVSVWRHLQSPMALPVFAGLALGVALSTALLLRSTPGSAADTPTAPSQMKDSPQPDGPESTPPASPDTPPAPRGPARPDSGADVGRRGPIGQGALTIRSGLPADAVVELMHEGGHRRRIYLRRGEQVTLLDLVAGSHQLRFATGTGWTGRWFSDTTAAVERTPPVTAVQAGPGAPVESVTLVFGDASLRATALLQPD